MKTVIGHSEEVDSLDAIADVLAQCQAALDGMAPKAGILFTSVEYDHQVILDRIAQAWPGMPLIGGSSDGEISSELGFCHDSVLLTLLAGDDLEVTAGLGRNLSSDIDRAAHDAVDSIAIRPGSLCLTTFAPTTNASEVVRQITARLGPVPCAVVGGLTGDHREFSRTREFFGREVLTDALPLLVISGNFRFSWGIGSGWIPIGTPHRVTRAEHHIVHEIDGQPALEVYRRHYGAVTTSSLGEYPLAVYTSEPDGDWSLRAILGSDEKTGSLTFAGEVPEGAQVRMTEVLPEGILSGSAQSLEAAIDRYPGDAPQLALIFSCAARKWVLGTQAVEEVSKLRDCATSRGLEGLTLAGLYCFGEIAPMGLQSTNHFHNETCVSLVLGG